MKKTLVALAALASVSAFAQATLSGVVRFGYQKGVDAATATTATNTALKASTGFALTDATFNLGVAEDLGGGLKANANVTFDQASSAFGNALNRRNTSLGLTGDFGSLTYANTRSSDLLNRAFNVTNLPEGLYNTSGIIARVQMDHLQYGIRFGAVSLGLGLSEHGYFNAAGAAVQSDGTVNPGRRTMTLSAGYVNGPLELAAAFKNSSQQNNAPAIVAPAKKSNVELFGSYDLGVAKLSLGYDGKISTLANTNGNKAAIALGVMAPVGPATIGLNYAKRGTAKVTEFGVNYALSKRTSMNASFGNQSATAQAAPIKPKQSQYRFSVAHSF